MHGQHLNWQECQFLSTLSLRRATSAHLPFDSATPISIHALLAESDGWLCCMKEDDSIFLSTLSLRRATGWDIPQPGTMEFLSTLSLRRATLLAQLLLFQTMRFLSTLSLRRATFLQRRPTGCAEFLSTLSLRRATRQSVRYSAALIISIHALLAESD